MPKQRVHELAKELGYSKQELVSMINDLDLDISVGNYMTVLSPTEVSAVRDAVKSDEAPAKAKKKKKKVPKKRKQKAAADGDDGTGPAMLRRRRKPAEAEDSDEKSDGEYEQVGPTLRRRKVAEPEEVEEDAVAEASPEEEAPAEETPEEEVVADAAADEPEEEAEALEEVAEAEEEAAEEEAKEEATEEKEEEVAEAEEEAAEEEATEEKEEEEVAEAEEEAKEEATEEKEEEVAEAEEEAKEEAKEADEKSTEQVAPPSPAPSKKKKEKKKKKKPKKKKGAAKVVGRINEQVLKDRLAAEEKDFSPGPSRRKKKKKKSGSHRRGRTKRVVEGSDLYDSKSRRSRRRSSRKKKRGRSKPQKTEITEAAEHKKIIRIEDVVTVGDLAHDMGVKAGKVAMKLVEMGMMATVNTTLDFETATLIADEFGYTIENVAFDISNFYDTAPDPEEALKPRPPVVTVMGHVDHGKTSLLDAIRFASVTEGEAGGITQHIGAYMVETESGIITFLDTPGHEAFTALRMRGAKATDIVVLVVAADDGVMPQTVEAINHARDAGVPIVVAINKVDKPTANPDRVKTALAEYELIPEDWGGTTLFIEVSALERQNIDGLLEAVALQAEVEELKANPDRRAQGLVIEAELDIGRGPVTTVLVQRGTLKTGDIIVSGQHYGRVRTMHDDRGQSIEGAPPSKPTEITGLSGIPAAGEPFFVIEEERGAKRITENVTDQRRKETMASRAKEAAGSLEELSELIREGEMTELKIIIKGDVQGSVEALREAFEKLGNEEVRPSIIHTGVGGITENDVNLAASSETGAVIIGFNVRPDSRAAEVADKFGVKILTYSIIYDAIEQIHAILEGLLRPIVEEEVIGHAEVRETFSAPKVGTIAGCYVTDGLIRRNAAARLLRQGRVIYESTVNSLRRFKDDVREVKSGFECGTSLENFNDIKVGDVIEVFQHKEVAATLD